MVRTWDDWTTRRLRALEQSRLLRSLRPVHPFDASRREVNLPSSSPSPSPHFSASSPMEVRVAPETMRAWLAGEDDLGASTFSSAPEDSGHGLQQQQRGGGRWCSLRLFSSNDYLGMSSHPDVRAAAASAASRWGSGPRSSALVCGYTHEHRVLESGLASLKESEECLLFPTGYAVNVGIIPALCDAPDCHVFSDALNHASIVDGCKLAARRGARVSTYRHCDVGHLEVNRGSRIFCSHSFPTSFPCHSPPLSPRPPGGVSDKT